MGGSRKRLYQESECHANKLVNEAVGLGVNKEEWEWERMEGCGTEGERERVGLGVKGARWDKGE